jgi:hypothetical protein
MSRVIPPWVHKAESGAPVNIQPPNITNFSFRGPQSRWKLRREMTEAIVVYVAC